jgi:hypothetical protein
MRLLRMARPREAQSPAALRSGDDLAAAITKGSDAFLPIGPGLS